MYMVTLTYVHHCHPHCVEHVKNKHIITIESNLLIIYYTLLHSEILVEQYCRDRNANHGEQFTGRR